MIYKSVLKIAHISDIHFFHFSKNPLQIFGKRIFANLYHQFLRRKKFQTDLVYQLPRFLQKEKISHILISGDYTCSSEKKEFQQMQNFIQLLRNNNIYIFTLPGNHDVYTRKAYKKNLFFSYIEDLVNFSGIPPHHLQHHRLSSFRILPNWWLILIHCSVPSWKRHPTGLFSLEMESTLTQLLSNIPYQAQIIVACHFPLHVQKPNHLIRKNALERILRNDQRIKLYLHGHQHLPSITQKHHFFTSDSGSVTLLQQSTINVLCLSGTNGCITRYKHCSHKQTWKSTGQHARFA